MANKSIGTNESVRTIQVSTVVARPVEDVFEFYATDHVRNHPRWDPEIELEQVTDGPIGVGTVIRRHHTHFDEPVEGTMEITEFEPNEAMGAIIEEGGMEIPGRATFEERGPEETRLTLAAEFPTSIDTELIRPKMERSAQNIKELIESEQ